MVAVTQPLASPVKIRQRWDLAEVDGQVVWEWRDYLVDCDGAEALLVGTAVLRPIAGSRFLLRFENRVGHCLLQPLRSGVPFVRPRRIEIASSKLGSYDAYRSFTNALVEALYAFGAEKVFDLAGETSLGTRGPVGERSLLFLLHYLLRFRTIVPQAVAAVCERPHLALADQRETRRLAHVSHGGRDLVEGLIRGRGTWDPAGHLTAGVAMNGFLPSHVECLRGQDSTDNPENRFVLEFVESLLNISDRLQRVSWWHRVPATRRTAVLEMHHALSRCTSHPTFSEVRRMTAVPVQSRVLTRREGYRQLFDAWGHLNQAANPLFDQVEQAIELRDVDKLYEQWCFFELSTYIGSLLGCEANYVVKRHGAGPLEWNAKAEFGDVGALEYNATMSGYSLPFRPDLIWRKNGKGVAVFDAKFRAEKPSATDDDSDPKRADLDKMHAYRDALRVPNAIVLYPGTEPWWFPADDAHDLCDEREDVGLQQLLNGWRGVGAVPFRPGSKTWQ